MAKLSLICLRWKLHSKPEKELNWPKTPHKINGISLLPRPAVLQFSHVSESPRGHRLPTLEFMIYQVWGGSPKFAFIEFPRDAAGPGSTLWEPRPLRTTALPESSEAGREEGKHPKPPPPASKSPASAPHLLNTIRIRGQRTLASWNSEQHTKGLINIIPSHCSFAN